MQRLVMLVLLALALPFAAVAQQLKLPDGIFASSADYIVGTWKWERQQPRQTVIMRFDRNGAFYFHNSTLRLEHHGSYGVAGGQFNLRVNRTCDKGQCADRKPPMDVNYDFTPVGARVFLSNDERWERQ
ncbi:MAG: hypothetical protein KIT25_14210 [Enhydrobacter sp.]|nr:MAG: hypothetical protein KIT25_14210 [Enhydrobacter sp.]